jgi:hypothetical protein
MPVGAAAGRISAAPLTVPRLAAFATFTAGALAWTGLDKTTGGAAGAALRNSGGGTAPGACRAGRV